MSARPHLIGALAVFVVLTLALVVVGRSLSHAAGVGGKTALIAVVVTLTFDAVRHARQLP